MGQSESISSTPRRRWLRFSLKSIAVIATILCIWLGLVSSQAHRQRLAITRFKALGGKVTFDYQTNSARNRWALNGQIVPAAVREFIGEDYFRTLTVVSLSHASDAVNDDLKLFEGLSAVEEISLNGVTRITDDGLSYLAGLNSLKVLSLDRANIEGSGLRHLRSLHKLKRLSIDNVPLIDEDLDHLVEMQNLLELSLANTRITDRGLQTLAKLHSLVVLDLSDTKITDVGLKHLETLTSLRGLRISTSHTTTQGRADLQKSLPNCQVTIFSDK